MEEWGQNDGLAGHHIRRKQGTIEMTQKLKTPFTLPEKGKFNSQYSHGKQLSVIPLPGDQTPSSVFLRHYT